MSDNRSFDTMKRALGGQAMYAFLICAAVQFYASPQTDLFTLKALVFFIGGTVFSAATLGMSAYLLVYRPVVMLVGMTPGELSRFEKGLVWFAGQLLLPAAIVAGAWFFAKWGIAYLFK